MSWFNMWDDLKNKTCRYLLQRYLGQFLDEQLNLEQLKVDLYDGKATINNVLLRVEALNELLEVQNWPIEFTYGYVGQLTVIVPWNTLMTSDSFIEATDVRLCLRPVRRHHDCASSMLESMWSSVSSSLQLAEEFMKQNEEDEKLSAPNNIIGLEKFAETIDGVLNRIRAQIKNIEIAIEYPIQCGSRNVVLLFHLDELKYENETLSGQMSKQSASSSTGDNQHKETLHLLSTYAKHNITINGIEIFTEESESSDSKTSCHFLDSKSERLAIMQIKDRQSISIKVKQLEEIKGPKVSFDIELGSVYIFALPQQIYLITCFFRAFSSNHCIGDTHSTELPSHFDSAENIVGESGEFHRYQSPTGASPFSNYSKWQPEEVSRDNNDVKISSGASDITSISSCSTLMNSIKNNSNHVNTDSSVEISNFIIKIGSCVGIILQEDILKENTSADADSIFDADDLLEFQSVSKKIFSIMEDEYTKEFADILRDNNYILLRMHPICMDGKQQRNKNELQLDSTISINKLQIWEIVDRISVPLISFDDSTKTTSENCYKKPDIKFHILTTNNILYKENSSMHLDIELKESTIEVDISFYDRMSALIGKFRLSDSCNYFKRRRKGVSNLCNTHFNVTCFELKNKIRFPIIDGRFTHSPDRVPWWKRNLTNDFFLLIVKQFKLQYKKDVVEVTFAEMAAFYNDEPNFSQTEFLKCRFQEGPSKNSQTYPRIIIQSLDERNRSYDDTNCTPKPFSSKRSCRQTNTFTNEKRDHDFFRHIDVAKLINYRQVHPLENYCASVMGIQDLTEVNIAFLFIYVISIVLDQTETMLFPGETREIEKFCNVALSTSKLKIIMNFPNLNFFLRSKQLYEIIYNRVNNNIFMWEPCSPHFFNSSKNNKSKNESQWMANAGLMDSVYISAVSHESESSCSYSVNKSCYTFQNDAEYGESYHNQDLGLSSYDKTPSKTSTSNKPSAKPSHLRKETKLNNLCFEICIAKIALAFYAPVRGVENHIMPEVFGKFIFIVENLKLFFVNGFRGDNNLAYMCAQISDAQLHHNGYATEEGQLSTFEYNFNIEEYMQTTLYKLPKELPKNKKAEDRTREMVSVVLEIKKVPSQKIKRLKVTTGLTRSALRYYPSPSSYTWIIQLLDFLDVTDYPIEGYEPFHLITEMQLHLWDCAIDFRPDNFPYRAVVEIAYFSISSNIVSSVIGCNLRFIMEECLLSLAPYDCTNQNDPINKITYICSNDLIPVLDIELLDISLRLSESMTDKFPKFDLRCSMHDVHMRTCYDSGCALARFINYIVNYPDNTQCQKSQTSTLCTSLELSSSEVPIQDVEITKEHQERLNLLMAEALQETHSYEEKSKDDCIVFPGSSSCRQANVKKGIMKRLHPSPMSDNQTSTMVTSELGKIGDNRKSYSDKDLVFLHDYDEDYCVIGKEEKEKVGKVKVSNEPLNIVDNHFCIPAISDDLLRAPENFPTPENRITLCEMTFTWHLYGGQDFDGQLPKKQKDAKRRPSNMSNAYRQGVSDSESFNRRDCEKKVKDKITWKTAGGSGRNHEVLVQIQFSKVRFNRELYSPHCAIATRQVLMVHEIEVRDRLQTSEINKLLYNPNKDLSNKTSHYMVSIKALHVRPNPNVHDLQECSLRISLSPIRLHIDQDTLEFLSDFVLNFGKECDTEGSKKPKVTETKPTNNPSTNPIINIGHHDVLGSASKTGAEQLSESVRQTLVNQKSTNVATCRSKCDASPTYFREVIFSPEISICFDYHGRRVEFSKGPITGLLMGLGQLQCSRIFLKKIVYRRGLLGFEKLVNFMCKEWVKDIKRNQLPKILSGIGPTYALVQLLQGIFDLFWLPFEYYQKDGRVMRGMQLGAQSFSARTILAAIELTSRIIQLLQFTAETAFDIVSPGSSLQRLRQLRKEKKRPKRPKDIREGVVNAYQIVKEGINDSASNLIETAIIEHDQKGLTGAVGAVIRQVPQLVVCPAVLATQATTNILGGVKSSLVPETEIENKKKWKDDNY